MEKGIRIIAQCYEIKTGKIVEESTIRDDLLSKAETLHGLGYRHVEQIDLLQKVQDFKIKYPVILDNNYVNWKAYGNNYWPRDYLVDNQGLIRYNHIGEGGYAQTEQMIKSLLAEGVIS